MVEEAVGVVWLISRVAAVTLCHSCGHTSDGMSIEMNRPSRGEIMSLRGWVLEKPVEMVA